MPYVEKTLALTHEGELVFCTVPHYYLHVLFEGCKYHKDHRLDWEDDEEFVERVASEIKVFPESLKDIKVDYFEEFYDEESDVQSVKEEKDEYEFEAGFASKESFSNIEKWCFPTAKEVKEVKSLTVYVEKSGKEFKCHFQIEAKCVDECGEVFYDSFTSKCEEFDFADALEKGEAVGRVVTFNIFKSVPNNPKIDLVLRSERSRFRI